MGDVEWFEVDLSELEEETDQMGIVQVKGITEDALMDDQDKTWTPALVCEDGRIGIYDDERERIVYYKV